VLFAGRGVKAPCLFPLLMFGMSVHPQASTADCFAVLDQFLKLNLMLAKRH
jgi:hypothetical protein